MKLHLSLIIMFNLAVVLITQQSLLASAWEEEGVSSGNKSGFFLSFETQTKLNEEVTCGEQEAFTQERGSSGVRTRAAKSPRIGPLLKPHEELTEVPKQEFFHLSRAREPLPAISTKKDVNQEVDLLIRDMESLTLVQRSLKEDEKVQSMWSRFPSAQIGELQQAIVRRTPQSIGSMTMYVSNGLAKFLVIDAIPFPGNVGPLFSSTQDFFAHFFDLKEGEEIFTSPINIFGDERSYAFSKDSTSVKKISFKLILKRLHLDNQELSKFSVFHPLELKRQTFEPCTEVRKSGGFLMTSVHTGGSQGREETMGVTDFESLSDSEFSIAHVKGCGGFLTVVYACPEPEFDLDNRSLNIYDPETKAFRYFHVKLQPEL